MMTAIKVFLILLAAGLGAFLAITLVIILNVWKFWSRADWIINTYDEIKSNAKIIDGSKEKIGKYYTIDFSDELSFRLTTRDAIRDAISYYKKYEVIYKDHLSTRTRRNRLVDILEETA